MYVKTQTFNFMLVKN